MSEIHTLSAWRSLLVPQMLRDFTGPGIRALVRENGLNSAAFAIADTLGYPGLSRLVRSFIQDLMRSGRI